MIPYIYISFVQLWVGTFAPKVLLLAFVWYPGLADGSLPYWLMFHLSAVLFLTWRHCEWSAGNTINHIGLVCIVVDGIYGWCCFPLTAISGSVVWTLDGPLQGYCLQGQSASWYVDERNTQYSTLLPESDTVFYVSHSCWGMSSFCCKVDVDKILDGDNVHFPCTLALVS